MNDLEDLSLGGLICFSIGLLMITVIPVIYVVAASTPHMVAVALLTALGLVSAYLFGSVLGEIINKVRGK